MNHNLPISKLPDLATADHPHFVGLALLRSLLIHDEMVMHQSRADAVLDLVGLLLRQAPASRVVQSFCEVRELCGPVCYMAIFRLRRWFEGQIMVKIGQDDWQTLDLSFRNYQRLLRSHRRQCWEWQMDVQSIDQIPVSFAWRGVALD